MLGRCARCGRDGNRGQRCIRSNCRGETGARRDSSCDNRCSSDATSLTHSHGAPDANVSSHGDADPHSDPIANPNDYADAAPSVYPNPHSSAPGHS